jgi:hypothetical protein
MMNETDRIAVGMKGSDLRCNGGRGAARKAEVTDYEDVKRRCLCSFIC